MPATTAKRTVRKWANASMAITAGVPEGAGKLLVAITSPVMQNASKLIIRPAELEDQQMVLGWAAAEGWHPGVRDAMPFFAADLNG